MFVTLLFLKPKQNTTFVYLFQSGRTYETINPATEKVICSLPKANVEDVNKAVAAAKKVIYFL